MSLPLEGQSSLRHGFGRRNEIQAAITLAQLNGEYVMPLDAGPAWRAAHAAGVDMSLIEDFLHLTPEQRLAQHQQVLDFLLEVQEAGRTHAAE